MAKFPSQIPGSSKTMYAMISRSVDFTRIINQLTLSDWIDPSEHMHEANPLNITPKIKFH